MRRSVGEGGGKGKYVVLTVSAIGLAGLGYFLHEDGKDTVQARQDTAANLQASAQHLMQTGQASKLGGGLIDSVVSRSGMGTDMHELERDVFGERMGSTRLSDEETDFAMYCGVLGINGDAVQAHPEAVRAAQAAYKKGHLGVAGEHCEVILNDQVENGVAVDIPLPYYTIEGN
jgi:hypothetical protein